MAFSTGNSNGYGGRFRRSRVSVGALSEMNVVPLVDVVLVLLIIFMLTAHVMEFGLDVQAPAVKNATETAEDLPVVTITRDAKLYLNDTPVKNINLLASDIRSRFKTNSVFVLADKSVQYGEVANVVSALGGENKFDIKLVAKQQEIRK
ncbi:MAG TPA: biopolymer transporter ExbD [Bryobacteraceae bacterium]|nr:biopolymer transporter ExbD [Bryobacteraceae bacterium]